MFARADRDRPVKPLVCLALATLGVSLLPWATAPASPLDDPAPDRRLEAFREKARALRLAVVARLDEAEGSAAALVNQQIAAQRAEADAQNANKTREVAEIAVKEYTEGTLSQELKAAEGELMLAKAETAKAKDRFAYAAEMKALGYISERQKLADEQAYLKARIAEDAAKEKLKHLRDGGSSKEIAELKANIAKAHADELTKQVVARLEKDQEAKLSRVAAGLALSEAERRAVRRLDAVSRLEDQWAATRGDEADRLAARAGEALDESARLWREAESARRDTRDAQAKERIRRAASD